MPIDVRSLSGFFDFVRDKLIDILAATEDVLGSGLLSNTKLTSIDTSLSPLTGTTDHFNGTVGTSPASVPSSAGDPISSLIISNVNTDPTKILYVSFDAGTTFKRIVMGDALGADLKGSLTQLQIKGAVAACDYEILMNRRT